MTAFFCALSAHMTAYASVTRVALLFFSAFLGNFDYTVLDGLPQELRWAPAHYI